MENPIYIGMTRQMALQTNMEIVANNIANINTPGYRGQNMVFEEYLSKGKGADKPVSMVLDAGQFQVSKAGAVSVTGNPLDVALSGPGFFGVETLEGTMYTRAGNFELNVNGELVTPAGYPVLDAGGGTIVVPPDAGRVKISGDGTISTNQGELARLMIVEFEDIQQMEARGDNLYFSNQQGEPATTTRAMQGAIEGSNVNPILEMTRMIEISKDYQSVQQMLQGEHDRQRSMIQKMTKT